MSIFDGNVGEPHGKKDLPKGWGELNMRFGHNDAYINKEREDLKHNLVWYRQRLIHEMIQAYPEVMDLSDAQSMNRSNWICVCLKIIAKSVTVAEIEMIDKVVSELYLIDELLKSFDVFDENGVPR